MIVRALKAGIKAKYLLMDSWFAMPTLISDVCKHIPVICMVKRTPKIHYIFEGQKMDVAQIYSQIRKRRGRAKILANAQIEFKDGLKAKLVFVRNKHEKDWLALLTTDLTIADEDVVCITVSVGTSKYSSARPNSIWNWRKVAKAGTSMPSSPTRPS